MRSRRGGVSVMRAQSASGDLSTATTRLSKPTIGIHVPGVHPGQLASRADYIEFFREAERLNFDALWAEDRILHPAPLADPLVLLTLAAAHTESMLLGTAVMVLNLRQAPVIARQLATLNHFCESRLAVGLSIGGRPDEYTALRVDPTRRVASFHESLHVLKSLLAGEPVTFDGHWYQLDGGVVRPAAPVPILLGAVADAPLRRAGRLADGWVMAPFGSIRDLKRSWSLVRAGAEEAGRDPDSLVAGRLIYVAVDDDRERARQKLGEFLTGYYGDSGVVDVDRDGIFGPPAEVAARLQEQQAAGISHLMLGVPDLDITHLQRLAAEVMPSLR